MNNGGSASICDYVFKPCFCLNYNNDCSSSTTCSSSEACVKLLPDARESYCVDCYAILRRSPAPIHLDSHHSCSTPSLTPTAYPVPSISNDSGDECFNSNDCSSYCASVSIDGSLTSCGSSAGECFCVELNYDGCYNSLDCHIREACVNYIENSTYSYCMSCNGISKISPKPVVVDESHYCNGNIPVDETFSGSTFSFCHRTGSFVFCDGYCGQMKNDGSVSRCDFDSQPCFCLDFFEGCTSSTTCSPMEGCVKLLPNASNGYCVDCYAILRRSPAPIHVDALHSCFTPSPIPTPFRVPSISDDSGDECSISNDCSNSCASVDSYGSLDNCSYLDDDCFCVQSRDNTCNSSSSCYFGEACVKYDENSTHSYCMSCKGIDRANLRDMGISYVDEDHFCEYFDVDVPETDNDICLSMNHITHLTRDELVFPAHRRAFVLCDRNGSCATPGHMVAFEGRYMMMKTYCMRNRNAKCVRRVTLVNSPRMRRRLRIASNSKGLEFTTLAAKYGTSGEEMCLAFILKVGF